ncbi:hypothetical protein M406DRAFT_75516 [Cryphonectria parasitica EP155]|uniref:Uncharacterized protein n=1 Tax=Cryphonectria parasitica (strain ATCC 38755 / EP155) TaxID=660469 RepID=A0A9P4Y7A2_CRYP1|nr:uncharacterized protein M406DRAFT_75516 [Cryphonectria parasitica EP155]KAF3768217.1 hypothetical protein M406DRAFT_75516 [Cryphonectria parasitica EP155]
MDDTSQMNDFFSGDWSSIWGLDQLRDGNNLSFTPTPQPLSEEGGGTGPADISETHAVHNNATSDVRSLFIMICSRLDKVEAINEQTRATLDESTGGDNVQKIMNTTQSHWSQSTVNNKPRVHLRLCKRLQQILALASAYMQSICTTLATHMAGTPLELLRETQSRPLPVRVDKPLPMTPLPPPSPLHSRRYLDLRTPPPSRPTKRALSWSEEQINTLQDENRKLRQQIIEQKRLNLEREQAIARLRQKTTTDKQKLNEQEDLIKQIANTVNVAFQDCQDKLSRGVYPYESRGTIDEIIQIYSWSMTQPSLEDAAPDLERGRRKPGIGTSLHLLYYPVRRGQIPSSTDAPIRLTRYDYYGTCDHRHNISHCRLHVGTAQKAQDSAFVQERADSIPYQGGPHRPEALVQALGGLHYTNDGKGRWSKNHVTVAPCRLFVELLENQLQIGPDSLSCANAWERAYHLSNSETQFYKMKVSAAEARSQQLSQENLRLNLLLSQLIQSPELTSDEGLHRSGRRATSQDAASHIDDNRNVTPLPQGSLPVTNLPYRQSQYLDTVLPSQHSEPVASGSWPVQEQGRVSPLLEDQAEQRLFRSIAPMSTDTAGRK